MINFSRKQWIGAVLGIAAGLVVAFLPPPEGLTREAMIALGISLWAIVFWIAQVFSLFLTSMLMCAFFALTKVVPFPQAFSGFSNSTLWFMIAALGMSLALTKSGLMKRFAYNIMRFFAPTFKGQVLGLIVSGIAINPFIPSTTAKLSMGAPIAKSVGEAMGYENQSRGIHGLFLAVVTGFMLMSVCFISANFFGYIAFGALPQAVQAEFNWIKWFTGMIPWGVVVGTGCFFSILALYKPEQDSALSKEYIVDELGKMGPLTKEEKFTMLIFLIAVVLWATERLHGVAGAVVAIIGMMVLMMVNVITVNDFKTKIPWDMIFLVGSMMSLGGVLNALGIQTYISRVCAPSSHSRGERCRLPTIPSSFRLSNHGSSAAATATSGRSKMTSEPRDSTRFKGLAAVYSSARAWRCSMFNGNTPSKHKDCFIDPIVMT